jgi:HAD superfamily hydrolase (TIGR01509 family)
MSPDDATYSGTGELLSRSASFAKHFGLHRLAIHHETIYPGRRTSLPHSEESEDEFCYVLKGHPDVWINGELFRLNPGDGVGFQSGTGLAHTVINNTNETVEILGVGEPSRRHGRVDYPVNPERNVHLKEGHWNTVPKHTLGPHDGQPDSAKAPLECLILDLGNVLVFHDNDKLFRELATVFDIQVGTLKSQFDSAFWKRVNTGELPGDSLRQAMCDSLKKQAGQKEFYAAWNCHFTVNEPMVSRVQHLVKKVRVGLLSNTHDWHFEYLLPRLPILKQFDFQVLSYEVGAMKPDVKIYESALKGAQCAAVNCAFFDDVDSYALAASRMNIRGRVFTDVNHFNMQLQAMGCTL